MIWIARVERQSPKVKTVVVGKLDVRQPPAIGKDYAKTAVPNTLSSPDSRRSYRFAIDDFVTWYCSEPRLAFSRTVVPRCPLELEGRHLAPSTINLRLAAVRCLAYEAADTGLLSPELAAGIRRVKGAKKVGVQLGNWLTAELAKRSCTPQTSKGFD